MKSDRAKPSAKRLAASAKSYEGALWAIQEFQREACAGNQVSADLLLNLAETATRLIEQLHRQSPDIVKRAQWGRHEFPVLRSWKQRDNEKRETMLRDLSIGEGLGLDVSRAHQDGFFFRLVEQYLSEVRVIRKILRNPRAFKLPEDYREIRKTGIFRRIADLPDLTSSTRRVWARVIADFKYPKDRPIPPEEGSRELDDYLEDQKIVYSRTSLETRKARRMKHLDLEEQALAKSGKLYPDDKEKLDGKRDRIKAMKATYGDFRSGFIDAVSSRLKTLLQKPTLKAS